MQFSDYYGVATSEQTEWFDPMLTVDTPLFIDPFLIYTAESDEFVGSHQDIVDFFTGAFTLVAQSDGDTRSSPYIRATDLLRFPEVAELCLGYSSEGTKGSGSGRDHARAMTESLWEAVIAGIIDLSHFEEIALLRKGIGPDRISDSTAGLLRTRLCAYTNRICNQLGVPLKTIRHPRGIYNREYQRWTPLEVQLPINPYNNQPIILVPKRYLRTSPSINADDFWDYCWEYQSDVIRAEFGDDITKKVPKESIIKLARNHSDIRKHYIAYREGRGSSPYNFQQDVRGFVKWYRAAKDFCDQNPLSLAITSSQDLIDAVEAMLSAYAHFVEERNGYRLLWNDDGSAKGEKAAQYLLLGIVQHFCAANNIDVTPEANIGRGPVDFKFSQGYARRVLVEAKLVNNSKFWNGLRAQLPAYMRAEKIDKGFFLVVAQRSQDLQRVADIETITQQVAVELGYDIRTIVVDATTPKLSASKL